MSISSILDSVCGVLMSISVQCELFSALSAGVKGIVSVPQSAGESDVADMSMTAMTLWLCHRIDPYSSLCKGSNNGVVRLGTPTKAFTLSITKTMLLSHLLNISSIWIMLQFYLITNMYLSIQNKAITNYSGRITKTLAVTTQNKLNVSNVLF